MTGTRRRAGSSKIAKQAIESDDSDGRVMNWRVIGFNFDFLCLNLAGFFAYSIFNIVLYSAQSIKDEYHSSYPFSVDPVMINDVVFSVHAFAICVLTGLQVLIYERGSQSVSRLCLLTLTLIGLYSLALIIVAGCKLLSWLQFLFYLSYIKLAVSILKYIPQALMNFRRKSTIGWSIGNILLDLCGGLFSLLQMFLISFNSDDWSGIVASPAKFGLGLASMSFDVLFIIQHYCLYRDREPPRLIPLNDELVVEDPSDAGEDSAGDDQQNLLCTSQV